MGLKSFSNASECIRWVVDKENGYTLIWAILKGAEDCTFPHNAMLIYDNAVKTGCTSIMINIAQHKNAAM